MIDMFEGKDATGWLSPDQSSWLSSHNKNNHTVDIMLIWLLLRVWKLHTKSVSVQPISFLIMDIQSVQKTSKQGNSNN